MHRNPFPGIERTLGDGDYHQVQTCANVRLQRAQANTQNNEIRTAIKCSACKRGVVLIPADDADLGTIAAGACEDQSESLELFKL